MSKPTCCSCRYWRRQRATAIGTCMVGNRCKGAVTALSARGVTVLVRHDGWCNQHEAAGPGALDPDGKRPAPDCA